MDLDSYSLAVMLHPICGDAVNIGFEEHQLISISLALLKEVDQGVGDTGGNVIHLQLQQQQHGEDGINNNNSNNSSKQTKGMQGTKPF